MKLKKMARWLGGEWIGSEDLELTGLCSIGDPREGKLAYVEKTRNEKDLQELLGSEVSAILIKKRKPLPDTKKGLILVKDVKKSLIQLLDYFYNDLKKKRSKSLPKLGDGVELGKNVILGAGVILRDGVRIDSNVTIGSGVYIGEGTWVHSQVLIEWGSILGKKNQIFGGVVLGSEGFGYYDDEDGVRHLMRHIGIVETGDDVDIGANSTVDRALIDKTMIGAGTKIDNLVQIGHNCRIGQRCYIAGQVGVSGSVVIGDDVVIAGQVGIRDHISIGNGVVILAQSGVTHSIKEKEMVLGFPARNVREARRILASLPGLAKMFKKMKEFKS